MAAQSTETDRNGDSKTVETLSDGGCLTIRSKSGNACRMKKGAERQDFGPPLGLFSTFLTVFVGLSMILDSEGRRRREEREEFLTRRKPAKRTHGTVVGAALVRS